MKRLLPAFILLAMLSLVIGAYVIRNWEPYRNLPQVSLNRLNDQETAWYAEGIADYRILVLVRFAAEQRRYDIVVRGHVLAEAGSSTWDEDADQWTSFDAISVEEAEFFTVPGMFTLLRNELRNENTEREVLRMATAAGATYPGLIYFGNLIQEGITMDGTELVIEVLEFEPLAR